MMPNKETGNGSGSSKQNGKRPVDNENSEHELMARENHHRHTPHQIQEMELFFQTCSHPDEKQRTKIGEDLSLDPNKVKYWFQNRRTQMKVHQDRNDKVMLKMENDNLKIEILRLKEAAKNRACSSSSYQQDAHQPSLEYSRLKEEYERFRATVSRFAVPSVPTVEPATSSLVPGEHIGDENKPFAMFHASIFLDELRMMCEANQLLWNCGSNGKEVLNLAEYHNRTFSCDFIRNEHMRIEASREKPTLIMMDSMALVERFCNADKWMEMFPSIVSKAKTLQIVQGPSGNLNGSLHLMYAEMQMLSHLVPPREVYFVRYFQQDGDGSWRIVDFPWDSLLGCSPFPRCRRKPSGCIITDIPRCTSSWVTWLEHVEVEDGPLHPIIDQFVRSGMAFGAERWSAVLERQGKRFYNLNKQNKSDRGVPFLEVKSNLMSIAERTIRSFCVSLSSLRRQPWMPLLDTPEDTVRLSTRSATQHEHPIGLILTATATVRLPYSYLQVFDLVRDIHSRTQMLEDPSIGNSLQELTHIDSGLPQLGNCISLFRIDHPMQGSSSASPIYMLQESYSTKAESVVAYTSLDAGDVSKATSGADPSGISILPSGFAMVPLKSTNGTIAECLLTVSLQILGSTNPHDNLNMLSAVDVYGQLHMIIHKIKMALSGASTSGAMDTGDRH